MTRSKVKLAWIVNANARKISFRKRRASLLKKMSELTILCDVTGFMIVYGPDSDEPAVWPELPVVEQLLQKFLSIPDVERLKKMTDQETYLKEKATKMQEQINMIQKNINGMEMNDLLHHIIQNGKPLHTFEPRKLTDLVLFMKERMKEIRERIDNLEWDLNVSPCATPHDGGEAENMSVTEREIHTESLYEYLRRVKGKQAYTAGASSSVRSDTRQEEYTYCSSSANAENEMGLPSANYEGNYNYGGSYLGFPLQIENTIGSASGVRKDIRQPPNAYAGNSSNATNYVMNQPGASFACNTYSGGHLGLHPTDSNQCGNGMEWHFGNLGVGSDIGMPHVNYRGNITGGSEMRQEMLTHYYKNNVPGSSSHVGNIGLSLMSYNGDTGSGVGESSAEYGDGLGHLRQQGIEGGTRSNIGMTPGFFGCNNDHRTDAGLSPRLCGGSSTFGNDVGLPYDVTKTWKTPRSP